MNRWQRVVLLGVLALAAFIGYQAYSRFSGSPQQASGGVAPATRGVLQASVSTTGSVKAALAVDIAFRVSGWVDEVYAQLGQSVEKGQPLAKLETASLELAIIQSQANLTTAQARLATLKRGSRPEEIEIATASLNSTRTRLEVMEQGGRSEDIATAEASVRSAQAKLDDLRAGAKAYDVRVAQAALASAQAKLQQLKNPSAADLQTAQSAVDTAQASLATTQAKLDQLSNPSRADITAAEATLQSAQQKLADLKDRPTTVALEDARRAVDGAKAALQSAQSRLAGFDNQLSNAAGGSTYRSAWSALNAAQARLEQDLASNASPSQILADQIAFDEAWRAVETTERSVNWSGVGFAAGDYAAAQAAVKSATQNLKDAQKKLADLDPVPSSGELRSAELAVESAQAKLDQLRNPTQADRQAAKAAVAQARSSLVSARIKLEQLQNPSQADLLAAQSAVEQAQASLERLLAGATAAELAAADASMIQAQSQLDKTKRPSTAEDIRIQRDAVLQAQLQLDLKRNSTTAEDILTAQAAVDQAQASLVQAQQNLANAVLRAPFAGVIQAANINPGMSVGSGTVAVALVQPGKVRIEVNVDETDIARLQLGQVATITTDALPDRTFTGRVLAIAPQAAVTSGVTTYLVSLSVEEPVGLRPGMTASTEIVYEQREGVLLVPSRAVKTVGTNRTVQVLEAGKLQPRVVRTGTTQDQWVEVVSGLEVGDLVFVEGTTTQSRTPSTAPGAGGGFVPGGRGGFAPGGGR